MQASRTEGRAALSRRGVLGAGVVLGLTGFGSVKAAPAGAYALEYFFDAQRTRAAVLSPSGAHIAVMMQLGTPAEPRGVIDVLDAFGAPLVKDGVIGLDEQGKEREGEQQQREQALQHGARFRS